jgi:hypothetical protein
MNTCHKKNFTLFSVLLFLILSLSPIVYSNEFTDLEKYDLVSLNEVIELSLLRGEHYLYIDATENVDSFNIKYAFPAELYYQFPIIMEIINDTTADIIDYKIENDTNEPNKIVNFTIGPMQKNEQVLIHFNFFVLNKNNDFSDIPTKVKVPKKDQLPPETIKWLSPTKVVQKNRILIRLRARQTRILTNNVLKIAKRIALYCRFHRRWLYILEYRLGLYRSQDAFTTLLLSGECPGKSHLGVALLRANKIPARVLLANRDYQFWYEMHYMTEYYLPNYGWVLTEVHSGKTPYETKKQIILRICYPEDENDTQTDFIYKKMKGLERWLWIDNENIKPYYEDCKNGSKCCMFRENEIVTDKVYGDEAINITKNVFNKYEYYLGMNLTGDNLNHFQNATSFQFEAINELKESNDIFVYILYLILANEE